MQHIKSTTNTPIKEIRGFAGKRKKNLVIYEKNSLIKEMYYSIRSIL